MTAEATVPAFNPPEVFSPQLEKALHEELTLMGARGDDAVLEAMIQVYAKHGEAPFDTLNNADMLARAFVFAEAHDRSN